MLNYNTFIISETKNLIKLKATEYYYSKNCYKSREILNCIIFTLLAVLYYQIFYNCAVRELLEFHALHSI